MKVDTISLERYLDYIMDYRARNNNPPHSVKTIIDRQLAVVGIIKVEYIDDIWILIKDIKDLE